MFFAVCLLVVGSWLGYQEFRRSSVISKIEADDGTVSLQTVQPARLATLTKRLGVADQFSEVGPKTMTINLAHTRTNDADLKEILQLKGIRYLICTDTNITDDGAAALAQHKELEVLNLIGCKVTDRGIRMLSQLPELAMLDIADTLVTDAAVNDLLKMPKMWQLNIGGESIKSLRVNSFRHSPPANGKAYVIGETVKCEGSFEYDESRGKVSMIVAGCWRGPIGQQKFDGQGPRSTEKGKYAYKTEVVLFAQSEAQDWADVIITTQIDSKPKLSYQLGRVRLPIQKSESSRPTRKSDGRSRRLSNRRCIHQSIRKFAKVSKLPEFRGRVGLTESSRSR